MSIEIDNSLSTKPFAYVADGEQFVIEAGQKSAHTSTSRIEVLFDNGHGSAKRKLLSSGRYAVAIQDTRFEIDLFDSRSFRDETSTSPTEEMEGTSNLFGP